ncbi:hypothetical protein IQ06DRAFT_152378 [Phaeosphaeriaceae sp. SRC1lsM3a]|nr:hypothetical protein IQ06DRAFT_152378 [Stagonospora sp. SRC1lsM3a]
MPGLLDLPNEIIYEIVHIVLLQARIEVPRDLTRSRVHDWQDGGYIAYIQDDAVYRPNYACTIALLLTCRRISGQTMRYLQTAPCVYRVDLAIVNALWFLPTWTSIPRKLGAVPGMVDKLEISLTPCRTAEEGLVEGDFPIGTCSTVPLNTPWSDYRERSGPWEYTMWSLITRFLAVGASGRNKDPAVFKSWSSICLHPQTFPLNLRVRVVVIDISTLGLSSTPIPHDIIPARQVHHVKYSEHDALYHVSAKSCTAIIKWLALELARVLTQARACAFKPIFERVGKFQFCVDGKILEELDVADYMYLEHIWDGPGELEERKELVRIRRELGL